MVTFDREGRFQYLNSRFKTLFGYDLDEVPDGRNWFRKAYPDSAYRRSVVETWVKDLGQIGVGKEKPRVFTVTCKDGTSKNINFISVKLETGEYLVTCEDITERKAAEEALHRRIELERIITSLSTRFISLTPDGIDSEIGRTVERIGEFVGADRSYVFLFSRGGKTMDNTHEWCAPGVKPQLRRLQGISVDEELPWFARIIKTGGIFHVPRVTDLPAEASAEKKEFEEEGIQSLIVVPMNYGTSLIGCLGFDAVKEEKTWSEDTINLLRIVGDIFANGLARKWAEETLKKREEESKRLAEENAIIAEIGRIISSTLDIDDVYERFVEAVQKILPWDRISVNIADHARRTVAIAFSSGVEIPGRSRGDVIPMAGTLSGQVIRSRMGTIIQSENGNEIAVRFPGLLPTFSRGFRSIMAVPLISKDQVLGSLHFRSKDEISYSEKDLAIAEKVANQVAGAMANALLFAEQKRSEEALRESETRFKDLYDHAPLGYHEYDIEGRITKVNHTDEEMLGYSAEELVGQYIWTLNVGEETVRRQVLAKLAGNAPPGQNLERTYRRKDGTLIQVLVQDRLLLDETGKIRGIRSTVQDITEWKRAKEEVLSLQEQLRQSQKMEAIGRLAGGIAHDFNNLLTVIKGYSQISLADLNENDPLRKNIEMIQKASERAADLTQQLLAFSRRQMMELKVLDLNALLKDMEKMLERIIGEDIELATLLAEDLGRTRTDSSQMEQAILNLAVNARDAMPSGGKLTIETANVELDEGHAAKHDGMAAGRYVMLAVRDTGLGMTAEVKEQIFDPFFTTKEQGKGTGLGLSMVYGIVKQSGGSISVYSEPGRGSVFRIYLPRVDEEVGPSVRRDDVKSMPRGDETVLLVEDESSVRALAATILRQQGYRVLEAPDGHRALLLAREHSEEKIHLLATDVVMPQMGGKELADRLKGIRSDLKILYMSGYTDNAIVHHGALDPGIEFLQKPFSPFSLAWKVREVLDRNDTHGVAVKGAP
jgi:PAS domain S-box-containing protein